MVYNNTTSYAKAKKHHINQISEKLSSYGGANNISSYLVSDSDDVADSNDDTISNSNGDTISNRNVNMDVASDIEMVGVGGGTGTGTEEDYNSTSDGTVTDIFQVVNIEEEASHERKYDLVDAEDMDISAQEEDKEYNMAVPVQEEEEYQEE